MRLLPIAPLLVPVLLAAQAPRVTVAPNLRVGPMLHNEPWITVSQTHPNVLITAAQNGDGSTFMKGIGAYVSRDGGRNWAPLPLPNSPTTAFDVMTAAGPDGRLYVMSGVIGGAFAAQIWKDAPPKSTIAFWSSADDGFTWDGPTSLTGSVDQDHMRMTVDMSNGPTRGRIYLAWNDVADQFVQDQYEIFLQWSDDHGKTFTQPKLIATGTDGKLVATEPVVLSDGTVLVTWYQYFNPLARKDNERMPMFVARSTDHGKTFGPAEKIFEFGPHVWRERVAEFSRAFSLPIVTADTSSQSRYRDQIYLTWDDVKGGASTIWFVRSADRGRTWSKPVRLNDNGPAPASGVKDYRMTPVVAVSPNGTVGVAWYDRRNDPNRMCWDYLAAFSTDGGATFGPNAKISSAPSCPPPGNPPAVLVVNQSPRLPDPNQLPDSALDRLGTIAKLTARIARENQAAKDEANRGVTTARLSLSFDPSRNVWPGHYTGLTADRNNVFHALWLDRREGAQQLYTTRVTLDEPPAPAAAEADLTRDLEVTAGPPAFDPAKNTVTVTLQLRNTTTAPVYGPILLRMAGVDSAVSFAGKLGTADRLLPGDLSEPATVVLPVRPDRGFDAAFDFTITGRKGRSSR